MSLYCLIFSLISIILIIFSEEQWLTSTFTMIVEVVNSIAAFGLSIGFVLLQWMKGTSVTPHYSSKYQTLELDLLISRDYNFFFINHYSEWQFDTILHYSFIANFLYFSKQSLPFHVGRQKIIYFHNLKSAAILLSLVHSLCQKILTFQLFF